VDDQCEQVSIVLMNSKKLYPFSCGVKNHTKLLISTNDETTHDRHQIASIEVDEKEANDFLDTMEYFGACVIRE
jgi:hypothetical protein